MSELQKATDEFIRVISDPLSSNEEVNASLQPCFRALPDSGEEDINMFMKRTFSQVNLPNIERASLATTICGYLVEREFPGDAIINDLIGLYDRLLDKSHSFFKILLSHASKINDTGEERDEAVNKIYSELISDQELVDNETYNAIISLDKFYACAISLFSVNKENFCKAKERLRQKVTLVAGYSQGCYWIDRLFTVLFDEPIVVIDIDNNIGFEGKINGVVDNYQLQHLLMNIPLLNDGGSAISEEDFEVVNGEGEQSSERTMESKWNMYNLSLCSNPDWVKLINNRENPSLSANFRQYWIWSEGAPVDIPTYNGRRVILLGLPPYSRSTRVQRTFKNLKANIEVEKELTKEEIDNWLCNVLIGE
ncbi:MAG: hypothetical protein LBV43_14400 [Prevotella sp.]|nr:hypothetical protein [Prevotella sp.]